jgi:cell division protein FtsI/penicillin-binding protein 2
MPPKSDHSAPMDRREFFKALLPSHLLQVGKSTFDLAFQPTFIWADLRTGQIGFPAGMTDNDVSPGALMHLIAAAAMLQECLVDPTDRFGCSCDRASGLAINPAMANHGLVDLPMALANGCDSYFSRMSSILSIDSFWRYCREFGLDQDVGKFPSGTFDTGRSASLAELVNGRPDSLRPTALQTLRLTALIAAQGRLPILHSAEENIFGSEPVQPSLSPSTWEALREAMHLSCRGGCARELDPEIILDTSAILGMRSCGNQSAATIAGFFPYNVPTYAFYAAQVVDSKEANAIAQARKYLFAQPWP